MMPFRKKKEISIPLPPEKIKEAELVAPRKRFFKNLSVAAIKRQEQSDDARPALPRGIWWGVGGLVVLFVGGLIVSLVIVRHNVSTAISEKENLFRSGLAELQHGDPSLAAQKFSEISEGNSGLLSITNWLGFLVQGGVGTVTAFMDVTRQFSQLSLQIAAIEQDAFSVLHGSSGADLVSHLKLLRSTLAAVASDTGEISTNLPSFGSFFSGGENYLSLEAQSASTQKFLDAFIPWISSPTPHHVLVMLQNPSEIRPAGGFLGSYADVTVASGTVTDISVHDVADADAAFTPNIVPPAPLQLEVSRWRPADANWFFDFPTSASETLSFFNQSEHSVSSTEVASGTALGASSPSSTPYFDAAIAVSPRVIQDLLSVTGPITVSSTKTPFTADNFLTSIQGIVQAGQASSATYPKAILRDIMSQLALKLSSLTDNQKQEILGMASRWIADKDIMIYSSDPDIESFLKLNGAAGDVYVLPQNFNGDYLAVVDANVNGGKSDLVMSENVAWVAQIGADGEITDNLSVTRTDTASSSAPWWYRTKNQVYLQVFTPPGSTLENESGGIAQKIVPKVNYAAQGYSTDPFVDSLAAGTQTIFNYPAVTQHTEDGKTVFATWSVVPPGATRKLSFEYVHQAFTPPAPGVVYQFIFEKQAGTDRNYSLEVDAPIGYVFAENGLPSWTLSTSTMPGRLIENLTLENASGT
jgi:hypothetical protein